MTSVPSQQASGSALLSSAAPEPSSYTLISADPQLYDDSDVQAYNELLEKISATVRPKDFIEEIWISDVVYLQVEIHSLRRLKVDLPKAAMPEALIDVFSLVANSGNWFVKNREEDHALTEVEKLVRSWYRHLSPAIENAGEYLPSQPDLSKGPIRARAFARELPNIARIDQLMASAEARRDAALESISRRRAAFAEDLRRSMRELEDMRSRVDRGT